MLKLTRTVLVVLSFIVATLGNAQTQATSGASVIENQIQSRFDRESGGNGGGVWKRPWRVLILFNSSNAASNSAYTDLALTTVREFLTSRLSDGEPHKVWFYPYQLDLYTSKSQSIEGQVVSDEVIKEVEGRIPRVPFETLSDGKTPYPKLGGHSNIAARKSALARMPVSSDPLLIIQITDTGIGESPGSSTDRTIRQEDQRSGGLDGSGITAWDAVPRMPTAQPNQFMTLFLYGPDQLVPNRGVPWFGIVIGIIVVGFCLGVALFLLNRREPLRFLGSKPWSVTIPGNGAIVLGKGERCSVFGPGIEPPTGVNFAVLRREGAPAATLFEVVHHSSGLQIVDGVWAVRSASSSGPPLLSDSAEVTATDKTNNKTQRFKIEVAVIEKKGA